MPTDDVERVVSTDGEDFVDTGAKGPEVNLGTLSPRDHLMLQMWQLVNFAASQCHLQHHADGPDPNPDMEETAHSIIQTSSDCLNRCWQLIAQRQGQTKGVDLKALTTAAS